MRRSMPLLLALCSLPFTGLLVASAAAPTPRPAVRRFAAQPAVPRAKQTVARRIDPQLAAVAVSLLRRYADDAADPTDLDLGLRKRLKRAPGARAAAKRLLGRIDGLAPAKRAQTFGKETKAMRARLSRTDVARLAP